MTKTYLEVVLGQMEELVLDGLLSISKSYTVVQGWCPYLKFDVQYTRGYATESASIHNTSLY